MLRWTIKLSQVTEGVNIEFIKGDRNFAADAMSRLHDSTLAIEEMPLVQPKNPHQRRFIATIANTIPMPEACALDCETRDGWHAANPQHAFAASHERFSSDELIYTLASLEPEAEP